MIKKNFRTGVVTFTFDSPSKEKVYLVGDFNNWDANATPMSKKSTKWSIDVKLKPGKYQFKYLASGAWHNDHKADAYTASPFGGDNSIVIIP
ncbi:MAG: isoamylase early set domain-containing protein [Candidatus Omnitrophota bacterium]